MTADETTRNSVAADRRAIASGQLLGCPGSSSAPEFKRNNWTVLNIGIVQSLLGDVADSPDDAYWQAKPLRPNTHVATASEQTTVSSHRLAKRRLGGIINDLRRPGTLHLSIVRQFHMFKNLP